MKPQSVPIESLILNWDIYPRHHIDSSNVRSMIDAEEAGVKLPPIIADRKTKMVVDGFHRIEKNKRLDLPEIEVEWHDYKNQAEMVEDSIRRNLHGRPLDPYDKARCLMIAEAVGLSVDRLAAAMSLTVERLEDLRIRKTAIGPDSKIMPIKNTLRPFAGTKLTKEQVTGNERSSGMPVAFYANQLSNCLEKKLVDFEDANTMAALERLQKMMRKFMARSKV